MARGADVVFAENPPEPEHFILHVLFGAEGQGVSPGLIASARLRVRIPMPGAIESLNVAAAAAVCLFETLRRRQAE